jgi:hypothetical protein
MKRLCIKLEMGQSGGEWVKWEVRSRDAYYNFEE